MLHQAQSSVQIFHKPFASQPHILAQLSLKALSENSSKRSKLYKKYTLGCTDGVLSGCSKIESFRSRRYVLSNTKTCRIITEVFHFFATCFILSFLLRKFFKTVGKLLHLQKLHPKLICWGALQKVLIASGDRAYQIQYLAKIFPSPLASTLHIYFYLHLKELSEMCFE